MIKRKEFKFSSAVLEENDMRLFGYGWYNCSVECSIRGKTCSLMGLDLEYKDCDTGQSASSTTASIEFKTTSTICEQFFLKLS